MLEYIAGVDEAGRGPLAGPVVAAAVILNPDKPIPGLKDSKVLSEKKREALYDLIISDALSFAVAEASVEEIDLHNIFQASLMAMQRAVSALSIQPTQALIDGKHCPKLLCDTHAIVQGDRLIEAISAASILAKVTRDRQMVEAAKLYPDYGFDRHKGYPTRAHREAIQQYGVLPIHRRSFGPVKACLNLPSP